MSEVVTFLGGTFVDAAALQLVGRANTEGARVGAEFNGTPMVAFPGDTPPLVSLRWHYERILLQLKAGTLRIEDLE